MSGTRSFALPTKKHVATQTQHQAVDEERREEVKGPSPVSAGQAPLPEPALDYEKPEWSQLPQEEVCLEVLKQGSIVDTIRLPTTKEYFTCGRLPTCDLSMEHASISRLHAVLQCSRGALSEGEVLLIVHLDGRVFLFDLDSSHGTCINKVRVPPRKFAALRPGDMIRFGESTRLYILEGATAAAMEDAEADGLRASGGPQRGQIANPIKVLREWFQECGGRLAFERVQDGGDDQGTVRLRVILPAGLGSWEEDIVTEATGTTRKEAEDAVCGAVCQKLVEMGELAGETASTEWEEWKRRRQEEMEEEGDDFYDRTSKKRPRQESVETMESLQRRRKDIVLQLAEVEARLSGMEARSLNVEASGKNQGTEELEGADELEQYMANLENTRQAEESAALICERNALRDELQRLEEILSKLGPLDAISPADGSEEAFVEEDVVECAVGDIAGEEVVVEWGAGDVAGEEDVVECAVGDTTAGEEIPDYKSKYGY